MDIKREDTPDHPKAVWKDNGGRLELCLSGNWLRGREATVEGDAGKGWPDVFQTSDLKEFDSMLPAFLLKNLRETNLKEPTLDGLPNHLRALMELALSVPERSEAKQQNNDSRGLESLGLNTKAAWDEVESVLEFVGDTVRSTLRFLVGKAKFRKQDFWVVVQDCGVGALPIVALISFLIGMILAFVGNVQLANFGASIYVANLVGIAMVREMGVMMTAIIMSGRTGAAFAAHIGSMNANQEIDALKTFGFNPFDYLVLPRVFALVLMMPILTVYSNVIGILGGMLVGAAVGIPPTLFWNEMLTSVDLTQASLGVFKSVFFGVAIAISGCLQGMKSGGSSAAVGIATTRAVVASITAIIILDSLFAVIFTILKI
jgi:phospholipid/cholesterol/gamma-HCH transport system permease protein